MVEYRFDHRASSEYEHEYEHEHEHEYEHEYEHEHEHEHEYEYEYRCTEYELKNECARTPPPPTAYLPQLPTVNCQLPTSSLLPLSLSGTACGRSTSIR